MTSETEQAQVDARNARFWDELCGTGLAQSLGITEPSPANIERFDRAYFELYPYLARHAPAAEVAARQVLEIGLGYGTLGGYLVRAGADYHGLDIAEGPVEMMRDRLRRQGIDGAQERVRVGSALEIPYADETFDAVYSIGCLHHTGDLPRSVAEVRRVLRPGGVAVVMLYNRNSFRQLVFVPMLRRIGRLRPGAEALRALYDANSAGEAAPHTDYVTRAEARSLFSGFANVKIRSENFDNLRLPRGRYLKRELFLGNLGRVAGLDLYIRATR
jgi:SAM-dependent methyltransferase